MTMSTATDLVREFTYPLRSVSTFLTLLTFFVLGVLVDAAGILGLWLAIVILPAICRYLMMLLEARARGQDAAAPGIEMFSWVGNGWSIFPLLPLALAVWAAISIGAKFGSDWALVFEFAVAAVLPASLAVLAITHSPAESLNPVTIVRLMSRCGVAYWVAPAGVVAVALLLSQLGALPALLLQFLVLYLVFAVFGVSGAVIRPFGLVDDVEIHDAIEADDEQLQQERVRQRTQVLNHAYGFASRGNRAGALEHIYRWLDNDPEAADSWPWFLDHMLRWENTVPALQYAQRYLRQLLVSGECISAVKLMLRCQLIDPSFRPQAEDLALAIAAAEQCGNQELASVLSR